MRAKTSRKVCQRSPFRRAPVVAVDARPIDVVVAGVVGHGLGRSLRSWSVDVRATTPRPRWSPRQPRNASVDVAIRRHVERRIVAAPRLVAVHLRREIEEEWLGGGPFAPGRPRAAMGRVEGSVPRCRGSRCRRVPSFTRGMRPGVQIRLGGGPPVKVIVEGIVGEVYRYPCARASSTWQASVPSP